MPDALLSGGFLLVSTIKHEVLKRMLETAMGLSGRVIMVIDIDGITVRGIGPGSVAMLEISVPKESFESYEGVFAHVDIDVAELHENLESLDCETIGLEIEIDMAYLHGNKYTKESYAKQIEPKEFPVPTTYDGIGRFCREWLINLLQCIDSDMVQIGIDNKKEIMVEGEIDKVNVSYRLGAIVDP